MQPDGEKYSVFQTCEVHFPGCKPQLEKLSYLEYYKNAMLAALATFASIEKRPGIFFCRQRHPNRQFLKPYL
jgi:hypothetical protein